MVAILDQLKALPVSERLMIVEDLWNSIADDSDALPPLTDEQIGELDKRIANLDEHPESGLTWEQVQQHVRSRHGC